MRSGIIVILLTITVMSSSCESAAPTTCSFSYDERLQKNIVGPALSKRFGGESIFFDADKPLVERDGNNVELIFTATKIIEGHRLQRDDAFVIVLDACTDKVIESYDGIW